MFDDRLEVHSPGLPPAPVTVETLNRRERVHLPRNPLLVRALTALGYMRKLGEGIPRMIAEMEHEGFYPPRFEVVGGFVFQVTLQNQPVYDRETLDWLRQFDTQELTGHQKRLLVFARAHDGRFTSREFQRLVGVGIYEAASEIKALIRKGLARQVRKGGKVYQILDPAQGAPEAPVEFGQLLPILERQGYVTNHDIRSALNVDKNLALRIADRLIAAGLLKREGLRRWARYVRV